MASIEYLSKEQEDILKEIVNISFGMAASLIGDMLGSYAHLQVPSLDVISINDLDEMAKRKMKGKESFYITKQRFVGHFSGETMFVLDKCSARKFCDLLLGSNGEMTDDELRQPILELTNIITSSCVGKLCEMLNTQTIFSVPTIDMQNNISTDGDAGDYDNIIAIETALDLQKENINGHMFILLTREELDKLKDKLDEL